MGLSAPYNQDTDPYWLGGLFGRKPSHGTTFETELAYREIEGRLNILIVHISPSIPLSGSVGNLIKGEGIMMCR